VFLFTSYAFASEKVTLIEFSRMHNKELPQVYDPITKLVRTSVENNNLTYHFIVIAKKEEFDSSFPKVKQQVLKTVCSRPREKQVVKSYNANIIYSYENEKGMFLNQFMIKAGFCNQQAPHYFK
jgi:hypothetical protein